MKQIYAMVIMLLTGVATWAQTGPGGSTANLKLWVKSDANTSTTTNGSALDTWTYHNDGTKSFNSAGGERPTYNTNSINFKPAVRFSGAQLMDGPTGANAPIPAGQDAYSVIVVWRTSAANALQRVWSQRSLVANNDGVALFTFNGFYGNQAEISPFDQLIPRAVTANTWYISELNLLNTATNDLEIYDNNNISTGPNVLTTGTGGAGLRNLAAAVNRMGARNNVTEEAFNGDIAEIIVFDRSITTAAERARIFSYLSIKYGIHTGISLQNSSGTTIWNATTNSAYNNRVFGIGRDDNSALNTNISNSILTGTGNGVGITGQGNIVLEGDNPLSNNTFVVVGSNSGTLTEITTDLPVAQSSARRLSREWKTSISGTPGTLTLRFDFTGITTTGTIGTNTEFALMVDADGDGDFTTGTQRFYQPSFTGQIAEFSGLDLNDGEVFTLITFTPTALPVSWVNFGGRNTAGGFDLFWAVENNEMADRYEVEISSNGNNFTKVATVLNDPNKKNYQIFIPTSEPGTRFFRIHQFDLDGKGYFSPTIRLGNNTSNFESKIIGNPIQSSVLNLEINTNSREQMTIEVFSLAGQKIVQKLIRTEQGTNRLQVALPENLSDGTYLLSIIKPDGERVTMKFLNKK